MFVKVIDFTVDRFRQYRFQAASDFDGQSTAYIDQVDEKLVSCGYHWRRK